MKTEHKEIIARVFPDVLEKMAFMFAEPIEEDADLASEGEFVKAQMSFAGPFDGVVELIVPASLCPVMAENILGDFDPETPEKAYDALKEILNVTCGNVLTEIAGEKPVFDLTVPQVSPISEQNWDLEKQRDDLVAFTVDDQPVLIGLKIN